ncbi:putative dinucleotide-utilizing enzyme [Bradyrhizobium elkanii]|uniref:Dinucleotide-utilizing enzyme n=1 Tax=Bradyrhizobium elkanii TaxID=29448 RepID=A0ABV4F7P6_BRAEL|nr:hypothetical protein [Bradyrhizobium elkanii]MCP1751051.1 putative dinucleotide-utilizing enzyme [Bradyrhizobium elkanii]MCP1976823.1 putative dinucleotide-utilizing enzyme [Bradyrhizobium elkanii]MCS3888659.1 putative dinucleotide-utilizing enzyme [Bradyrhizobium elkanii]MCS4212319.1 putative dinucleotide-utilizing enzyme [Bradyrhizobium elkanii]MCW2212627.1 putative dinucleotide-utilizing enzyme [Bradyrhizobium elkanii]
MRVAVIGFGAIGSFVIEHLQADRSIEVSAAFSLPRPEACSVPVVDSLEALLATGPELVVECAGHGSLRDVGEAILRHGTDLLVASVGALADSVLEHALRKAAADGGGRLLIPGGALGGIDAVSAAREAGLDSVEYSGRKAPQAWKGTRAEQLIDLISVRQATAFFESRCTNGRAPVSAECQRRRGTGAGRARLRENESALDCRSCRRRQQSLVCGARRVRRDFGFDSISDLAV